MLRKMRIAVGSTIMLAGLLASSGMAQNQVRQQSAGQAVAHPTGAEVVTLTGLVIKVNMAPGQGMPSIILNTSAGDVTVLLGPYRLLVDRKVEIQPGELWGFKAFVDPRIANAYVATEAQAPNSSAWIVLRDDSGMPHMGAGPMGMGRGHGAMGSGAMAGTRGMGGIHGAQGAGACAHVAANVNFNNRVTLSGTVVSVDLGPGQGSPTITLSANGVTATILASPYPALMQAEFKVAKGDNLTVVGYPLVDTANTYLAAELQIGQNVLKLRDENGMPLAAGGRGPMKGIRR